MSVVLVDSSIWIDHLHRTDRTLTTLLERLVVVTHPMVIGELAVGGMRDRATALDLLRGLPSVISASHTEVMQLIEGRALFGQGLSYVDVHLLASALLTPQSNIWTRDLRVRKVAQQLGICYAAN